MWEQFHSLMSKDQIRESFRAKRQSLSSSEQEHASQGLVRHFTRLRYGISWLLYASIENEISTRPLFEYARKTRQDRVYFPRVKGEGLSFHLVNEWDELKAGRWNPEPSGAAQEWDSRSPSIIVVPGVAFSREGHRVGFGKGFYDRFLFQYRQFPRLAVGYDFQIASEKWDVEDTDQIMDYVITPASVWGSPRIV